MIERESLETLLKARLAGITPVDEVRAFLDQLTARRWKYSEIARRLGVSPHTVRNWYAGAMPKDLTLLVPLARITRAALPEQVPTRRVMGMQRVIFELQSTLRLSQKALARRIGRSESVCEHWMQGLCQPNRDSTARLLKLVRDHRVGFEYENLCEWHLKQIRDREERRRRISAAKAEAWEASQRLKREVGC
jgi:DNA-binding transcriptional regulator YiaG